MKKQIILVIGIISTFLLLSCNNSTNQDNQASQEPEVDFSNAAGVKNYLTGRVWSEWDGKLVFKNDGTCNFTKKNLRTEQIEWNINGTFIVDDSKFEDNGASYWYAKASWDQPGVINDYYTIYEGHLVAPQGVYSDSYGPVIKSFKSEGGLVLDRNKIFPISQ